MRSGSRFHFPVTGAAGPALAATEIDHLDGPVSVEVLPGLRAVEPAHPDRLENVQREAPGVHRAVAGLRAGSLVVRDAAAGPASDEADALSAPRVGLARAAGGDHPDRAPAVVRPQRSVADTDRAVARG